MCARRPCFRGISLGWSRNTYSIPAIADVQGILLQDSSFRGGTLSAVSVQADQNLQKTTFQTRFAKAVKMSEIRKIQACNLQTDVLY